MVGDPSPCTVLDADGREKVAGELLAGLTNSGQLCAPIEEVQAQLAAISTAVQRIRTSVRR